MNNESEAMLRHKMFLLKREHPFQTPSGRLESINKGKVAGLRRKAGMGRRRRIQFRPWATGGKSLPNFGEVSEGSHRHRSY